LCVFFRFEQGLILFTAAVKLKLDGAEVILMVASIILICWIRVRLVHESFAEAICVCLHNFIAFVNAGINGVIILLVIVEVDHFYRKGK